ncbi:MAG: hypothetical protein U0289_04475 [Cyclobacteriaceae bacterium]|nr:hypothetical protein [Cyclobacteriaceae bacterium]
MNKIRRRRRPSDIGGILGEVFILRKVRGQLQLISRPRPKPKKATPMQAEMRDKFRLAMQYAQHVASDPEAAALYALRITAKHTTVRMVALRDYMNPPVIHGATMEGERIRIRATDDFMVKEVYVKLKDEAGGVIAEGEAVHDPLHNDYWNFRMSREVGALPALTVRISAWDRPGNSAKMTVQFRDGRVVSDVAIK